jgi:hypothetical protein
MHFQLAGRLIRHNHAQQTVSVFGSRIIGMNDVMRTDHIGHGGEPGHEALKVARKKVIPLVAG